MTAAPALAGIADLAGQAGLFIAGTAPVLPGDGLRPHLRSIVLLSPDEPLFWDIFRAAPEASDGAPDRIDRWSRRVIGRIACNMGAKAYFPFGGPPYRPFVAWALRTGRVHASPVNLLAHVQTGLFFSVRGGIALTSAVAPDPAPSPCPACAGQPCRNACPAGALTATGYDIPACHAFLDMPAGSDCMEAGCRVRRACPVGQERRVAAQSAFHMKAFHPR